MKTSCVGTVCPKTLTLVACEFVIIPYSIQTVNLTENSVVSKFKTYSALLSMQNGKNTLQKKVHQYAVIFFF